MRKIKDFSNFLNNSISEDIDTRPGHYKILLSNLSANEEGMRNAKTPEQKQAYQIEINRLRSEIKEIDQVGLSKDKTQYS